MRHYTEFLNATIKGDATIKEVDTAAGDAWVPREAAGGRGRHGGGGAL